MLEKIFTRTAIMRKKKKKEMRAERMCTSLFGFVFLFIGIFPLDMSYAGLPYLPSPGATIPLSYGFHPVTIRGLRMHPDNPLKFDLLIDKGDTDLNGEALRRESEKIIRYFLASLTLPEEDLWVHLSPSEQDRVVPEMLGQTDMGRAMLIQDYILKQLTASLIHPENDLGKQFWDRVYKKAFLQYGTTNVPINTLHQIWIIPDTAVVYQDGDSAYLLESTLKVLLQEDYMDRYEQRYQQHLSRSGKSEGPQTTFLQDHFSSQVMREIIIPEIEKEVNEGKNFAVLRQVVHAWVLATWFKKNLQESFINRVYSDQRKVTGIDLEDKKTSKAIYGQYLKTLQKGVYDFIKIEYDQYSKRHIPRKYFSGGLAFFSDGISVEKNNPSRLDQFFTDVNQKTGTEGERFSLITFLAIIPVPQQFWDQEFGKPVWYSTYQQRSASILMSLEDSDLDKNIISRSKAAAQSSAGGVDFIVEEHRLKTRGQGIQLDIFDNLDYIDPSQVPGLVPVILHIVPVANTLDIWSHSLPLPIAKRSDPF